MNPLTDGEIDVIRAMLSRQRTELAYTAASPFCSIASGIDSVERILDRHIGLSSRNGSLTPDEATCYQNDLEFLKDYHERALTDERSRGYTR